MFIFWLSAATATTIQILIFSVPPAPKHSRQSWRTSLVPCRLLPVSLLAPTNDSRPPLPSLASPPASRATSYVFSSSCTLTRTPVPHPSGRLLRLIGLADDNDNRLDSCSTCPSADPGFGFPPTRFRICTCVPASIATTTFLLSALASPATVVVVKAAFAHALASTGPGALSSCYDHPGNRLSSAPARSTQHGPTLCRRFPRLLRRRTYSLQHQPRRPRCRTPPPQPQCRDMEQTAPYRILPISQKRPRFRRL
jgi:hypothetical protein